MQAIVYSALYNVQKPEIDIYQFLVFSVIYGENGLKVCEKASG